MSLTITNSNLTPISSVKSKPQSKIKPSLKRVKMRRVFNESSQKSVLSMSLNSPFQITRVSSGTSIKSTSTKKGNYVYKNYRNKKRPPLQIKIMSNTSFNQPEFLKPLQCKHAITLYSILPKKRNEFINGIKNDDVNTKTTAFGKNKYEKIPLEKNHFLSKTQSYQSYHCITTNDKDFHSITEKDRYGKHMELLYGLKDKVFEYKDDMKSIRNEVINFLVFCGIYDKKYFQEQCIKNFYDFLVCDFEVNPKIKFKEFLKTILVGKYDLLLTKKLLQRKQKVYPISLKKKVLESSSFVSKVDYEKYNGLSFNTTPKKIIDLCAGDVEEVFNEKQRIENSQIKLRTSLNSSAKQNSDVKGIINSMKKKGKLLEYICLKKAEQKIKLKELKNYLNLAQQLNI